jgi:hypothetical protein
MFLPPAYCTKDVKESDHISEIGLVIADEQYILFRKPVQALHTVYLQLIDDRESGKENAPTMAYTKPLTSRVSFIL